MTKKEKFIQMVHTITQTYVLTSSVNPSSMHVVLGKAYKVKHADLEHSIHFLSQKADAFVRYQLYLTEDKPRWYTGPDVK